MLKSTIKAILVIVGFWTFLQAAGAGPGSRRSLPPVILSTAVDAAQHVMMISGRHFGSAQPTVRLAHRVLWVKSASENQIVVDLPTAIEPATYRLTVTTNGPHRLTTDAFSMALFPVAGR